MLQSIRNEVTRILMNVRVQSAEEAQQVEQQVEARAEQSFEQAAYTHSEFSAAPDAMPSRSRSRCRRQRPSTDDDKEAPFRRFRREGRPQRPMPLRLGEEVQAVPRAARLSRRPRRRVGG